MTKRSKPASAKERLDALEAVVSALAHPSRRQILMTVWFRGGVVKSSEIAKRFQHAWPTTTRHLRVLESAGLLEHEIQGKCHLYRIKKERLNLVREWLAWFDVEPLDPPPES